MIHEVFYLLWHSEVQSVKLTTSRRNTSSPSSGLQTKLPVFDAGFFPLLTLKPWKCWSNIPPKRWLTFAGLHGLVYPGRQNFSYSPLGEAVLRYLGKCLIIQRLIENRVLRRVFGPRRDEVTGDWRKLHNEELHNLYSVAYLGYGRQGTCHGRHW
jgi:hypothetical protein